MGVICIDHRNGNLYWDEFSITNNGIIIKICMLNTSGSLMYIGNAKQGSNDGTANSAGLSVIRDINIGNDRALYLSDDISGTIRKIQKK